MVSVGAGCDSNAEKGFSSTKPPSDVQLLKKVLKKDEN